ncbi:MAG: YlbF family regulator [Eubacteriales bacterium]
MDIMELAAQLGKEIKNDERAKRFDAADAAFDSDPALSNLMEEYRTQRAALESECQKEAPAKEITEVIEGRIEQLYNDITNNPVYIEYSESREALDALMHDVNGEITFQITGERPCTHECGSCSCGDCGTH